MLKNILIIDDDHNFVYNVIFKKSYEKVSFSIADSIKRARFLLNNNKFDLIIANIKVPGGNSLDLKRDIICKRPNLRFFFMSNYENDYKTALDKGEECYYKYELNNYIGKVIENV